MPTDDDKKKLTVVTQNVLAPGEHLEGVPVARLLGNKERVKFRDHKIPYEELVARADAARKKSS